MEVDPKQRRIKRALGRGLAAAVLVASAARAQVAYLQRSDGYWQVWASPSESSAPARVTLSPSEKTRASWFPDGRSLLVCTQDGELLKVDIATGKERQLPIPLNGAVDAVLSPDGEQIAFSVSPARSRDDNEIFVAKIDGSNLRRLTSQKRVQHQPAWHPDGNSVFFVSRSGDEAHDIWRADLESGDLTQLTAGNGLYFDVAVRADGALAYSNNATGDYELYVQLPGEEPRALTASPGIDGWPTWSRDGRELWFESSRSGQLQIWRVSVDGGQAKQVTHSPDGAQHPAFAPARAGAEK